MNIHYEHTSKDKDFRIVYDKHDNGTEDFAVEYKQSTLARNAKRYISDCEKDTETMPANQ